MIGKEVVSNSVCNIAKLGEGDKASVFMYLQDLLNAFDSVEYICIVTREALCFWDNGKLLRVLKNWYEGGRAQIKLDGRLSEIG